MAPASDAQRFIEQLFRLTDQAGQAAARIEEMAKNLEETTEQVESVLTEVATLKGQTATLAARLAKVEDVQRARAGLPARVAKVEELQKAKAEIDSVDRAGRWTFKTTIWAAIIALIGASAGGLWAWVVELWRSIHLRPPMGPPRP